MVDCTWGGGRERWCHWSHCLSQARCPGAAGWAPSLWGLATQRWLRVAKFSAGAAEEGSSWGTITALQWQHCKNNSRYYLVISVVGFIITFLFCFFPLERLVTVWSSYRGLTGMLRVNCFLHVFDSLLPTFLFTDS